MSEAAEKITHALEGALALLRDAAFPLPPADEGQQAEASLLQQCLAMCEHQESRQPEPVRTVHHFACTGGTLISKETAIEQQSARLTAKATTMTDRLARRRAYLLKQYAAMETALAKLKQQSASVLALSQQGSSTSTGGLSG